MNFELSENKNFLLKKKKTDGNKMEIWWRYLVITKIKQDFYLKWCKIKFAEKYANI